MQDINAKSDMHIRRLQDNDFHKLEPLLSVNIETSMFLLSNMRRSGLEYKSKPYHGDYFGAFDNKDNIIGVIAHYWNGNIMMQAKDLTVISALTASFHKAVTRPVAGILGADAQAKLVIDELGLTNDEYALNSKEGLYVLDLEKLAIPKSIFETTAKIVDANEIDIFILRQWFKDYEIEALGADDNEALVNNVENRIKSVVDNNDCWVLVVNGKPVSLSGFNCRLTDIVQIGPVWTPIEYRNKGYARWLVAKTLEKAKMDGVKKSILFTNNPSAVRAYEAIGFNKIGSYRLSLLKKAVDIK